MTTVPLDGLGRELDRFTEKLYDSLSAANLRRVGNAAGMAAKKAGTDAVIQRLGPDRAMSGTRRRGRPPLRLGLGYDIAGDGKQVQLNHRPSGLWKLATEGRQRSGNIYPIPEVRRRGKRRGPIYRRAVMTPFGLRSMSSYGPQGRKPGVFKLAVARERDAAPRAAFEQLVDVLRRSI